MRTTNILKYNGYGLLVCTLFNIVGWVSVIIALIFLLIETNAQENCSKTNNNQHVIPLNKGSKYDRKLEDITDKMKDIIKDKGLNLYMIYKFDAQNNNKDINFNKQDIECIKRLLKYIESFTFDIVNYPDNTMGGKYESET